MVRFRHYSYFHSVTVDDIDFDVTHNNGNK